MEDVAKVTKDIVPDDIALDRVTTDMPQAPWTIDATWLTELTVEAL